MRRNFTVMRSLKIKFIVFTFAMLFLFHFLFGSWLYQSAVSVRYASVVLEYVVVHLDLKGAPPKLGYLESLLPKFKELGVNGILIEYEDMFPYEGRLLNLSARNCYKKDVLRKFILKTVGSGIEVIPLVQTFGHMEHALKLQEFQHLREKSKYADSLCPSKSGSKKLINDMLEQVINFHSSIAPLKHIHIGCDEVYHMNKCSHCRSKSIINLDIFYDHVRTVENIVRKFSPITTVLIWDDMLRGKEEILDSTIDFKNIEPVCWDYLPKLKVSHIDLYNYHRKFKNIWIASAFKGADGRTATFTNFKKRFVNNLSWLDFILNYKFGGETAVYNFKGIILTGWSRYSHMDPLCELLPNSMPSLILNLILIKKMQEGIVEGDSAHLDYDVFYERYLKVEFNKYVKCKDLHYIDDFDNCECTFENNEIYNHLHTYNFIMTYMKRQFENADTRFPTIEYYSKIKTFNLNSIHDCVQWCNGMIKRITLFKTKLRNCMSKFFEIDTIDEYVNYKTYESETKVRNALKIVKSFMDIRTWERRPLDTNISVS